MLKNKKKYITIFMIVITLGAVIATIFLQNNSVEALSKYGSRGEEVRQIKQN